MVNTLIKILLAISVVLNISFLTKRKFQPIDILEKDPNIVAYSYTYYEGQFSNLSVWSNAGHNINLSQAKLNNFEGNVGGFLSRVNDIEVYCVFESSIGLAFHSGLLTHLIPELINLEQKNISVGTILQEYKKIYEYFSTLPDNPGIDEIREITKDLNANGSDERPCWKTKASPFVLSFREDLRFFDRGVHFRRK